MSRHLVTTADERSWPSDEPVLFLGEWCRRYERRDAWSSLDAVTARPYGVEPGERERDRKLVLDVAGRIRRDLTTALNTLHGTAHSARFWEILIGHWVIRFTATVWNRYATLVQALDEHDVDSTTVFDVEQYRLATSSTEWFKWASNDPLWNHALFVRVLEYVGRVSTRPPSAPVKVPDGYQEGTNPVAAWDNPLRVRLARALDRMLPLLSRDTDAVFINTYLPLRQRVALELSLGQAPQVRKTPAPHARPFDPQLRQQIALDSRDGDGDGDFEGLVRSMAADALPICFAEGFESLQQQVEELPWPRRPRFIFASNGFDGDEVFKLWTAGQAERGVPYVAGQHGNNYGTHVWAGREWWPERSTSDRFATWGWSSADNSCVPAFTFRTAGRTPPAMPPDGGLLLVEVVMPHRIETYDVFAEFADYQEDQFRFVEALPAAVQQELTVRLYAESRHHPWGEYARWRDRSPRTRLDDGTTPFQKLVERSRLLVYSYDSTGILEALALGLPVIAFWQDELSHVLPEARPDYELLREAGIIHTSPESAAALVSSHWDDIAGWWDSEPVRIARAHFAHRYALGVDNPVRTLRSLLLETSSR